MKTYLWAPWVLIISYIFLIAFIHPVSAVIGECKPESCPVCQRWSTTRCDCIPDTNQDGDSCASNQGVCYYGECYPCQCGWSPTGSCGQEGCTNIEVQETYECNIQICPGADQTRCVTDTKCSAGPPTTTMPTKNNVIWINTDGTFTLKCKDENGCSKTYYQIIDATSVLSRTACPTTGYIEGTYSQVTAESKTVGPITVPCASGNVCIKNVCFYSVDTQNNEEPKQRSDNFRIDKKNPEGGIIIQNDEPYTNSRTVQLTLDSFDVPGSGVKECKYYNDGLTGTFSPESCTGTKTFELAVGSDGERKVWFDIKDNAGNLAGLSDTIKLDTQKPIISIQSPQAQTYASSSIEARVVLNEEGQSCAYSFGTRTGVQMAKLSERIFASQITGLVTGQYTIRFTCQDLSGNQETAQQTFSVDTIPPTLSNSRRSQEAPNEDQDLIAYITATDNKGVAEVLLEWNGTTNYTLNTKTGDEYFITIKRLNYTAHDFAMYRWYSRDASGLWSVFSSGQEFTVQNRPPFFTFPPTINVSEPKTHDALQCNNGTFEDEDNEDKLAGPTQTVYKWAKNGVDIQGQTSNILDLRAAGNGDKGNTIVCMQSISDGYESSQFSASQPVTIQNSPPTLLQGIPNQNWPRNGYKYINLSEYFIDLDRDSLQYFHAPVQNLIIQINNQTANATISGDTDFFGERTIKFMATDGQLTAESNEVALTIQANNNPPVVDIISPESGTAASSGIPIEFRSIVTDSDQNTLTLTWNFGDGIIQTTGNMTIYHTYTATGRFNITLTAFDGLQSSTDSIILNIVDNSPPQVSLTYNNSVLFGDVIEIKATIKDTSRITNSTLLYNGSLINPSPPIDISNNFQWLLTWRLQTIKLGSDKFTIFVSDIHNNNQPLDFQFSATLCTSGEKRECGKEVGICKKGTETCLSNGNWSECVGELRPRQEICDGVDNDCDGFLDNIPAGTCACRDGTTQKCSSNIGTCREGTQTCNNGVWGQCSGVLPIPEACDGFDNDCNGIRDDNSDCCFAGQTRPCGPSTEEGICRRGTQQCINNIWSADTACEGAVSKAPFENCEDNLDNDCDGTINNGCETCDNGIKDGDEEGTDCGGSCTSDCDGIIPGVALIGVGAAVLIIITLLFLHFKRQGKELTWGELKSKWGEE